MKKSTRQLLTWGGVGVVGLGLYNFLTGGTPLDWFKKPVEDRYYKDPISGRAVLKEKYR